MSKIKDFSSGQPLSAAEIMNALGLSTTYDKFDLSLSSFRVLAGKLTGSITFFDFYGKDTASVPGAPIIGVATRTGTTTATITYSLPTSPAYNTGNSVIDLFTATATGTDTVPGATQTGTAIPPTPGATPIITVINLTTAKNYKFKVKARNAAGYTSVDSADSAPILIAGTPGPPTSVNCSASINSCNITWTAPLVTGGGTVHYDISCGGQSFNNISGTSYNVTGLTANTNYSNVTITADNTYATTSATTSFTTLAALTVPSQPSSFSVVSGTLTSTSVTLQWGASTANPAVSSYNLSVVGPAGSSFTFGGTTTTRNITGLTPGGSYTFYVNAQNTQGTSASSSVAVIASTTTPSQPTIGTATTLSCYQATLTWTVSSTGGLAITNHRIKVWDSWGTLVNTINTNSAATSATITGLLASKNYAFSVAATNSAGYSTDSYKSNTICTQGWTYIVAEMLGSRSQVTIPVGIPQVVLRCIGAGGAGSVGTGGVGSGGGGGGNSRSIITVPASRILYYYAAPATSSGDGLNSWINIVNSSPTSNVSAALGAGGKGGGSNAGGAGGSAGDGIGNQSRTRGGNGAGTYGGGGGAGGESTYGGNGAAGYIGGSISETFGGGGGACGDAGGGAGSVANSSGAGRGGSGYGGSPGSGGGNGGNGTRGGGGGGTGGASTGTGGTGGNFTFTVSGYGIWPTGGGGGGGGPYGGWGEYGGGGGGGGPLGQGNGNAGLISILW